MGARLISKNGQIITKLKSGQDDVKVKYEQINGKFEPVYYDGYVLYNSLKSNGNAYIDLGHVGDSTHRYELDFYMTIGQTECAFGARTSYNDKGIYVLTEEMQEFRIDFRYNVSDGTRFIKVPTKGTHRYKTSMSNTEISYNVDGVITNSPVTLANNFTTDINLRVFLVTGPAVFSKTITFHSIKEYDQTGQLIYHYVPARRQSDNQLGMLDVINGVFYGNANSVGMFEIN